MMPTGGQTVLQNAIILIDVRFCIMMEFPVIFDKKFSWECQRSVKSTKFTALDKRVHYSIINLLQLWLL